LKQTVASANLELDAVAPLRHKILSYRPLSKLLKKSKAMVASRELVMSETFRPDSWRSFTLSAGLSCTKIQPDTDRHYRAVRPSTTYVLRQMIKPCLLVNGSWVYAPAFLSRELVEMILDELDRRNEGV
jgi:hypothetical protein